MVQKKIEHNNNPLSNINNIEDLQAEIKKVQAGIRERELDLEKRWSQLPSEMVKSTIGTTVPFLLNNAIASKTLGLVSNAGSFLLAGASKGGLKTTLLRSAKQLGLFAAIRGAYNLWKKK